MTDQDKQIVIEKLEYAYNKIGGCGNGKMHIERILRELKELWEL